MTVPYASASAASARSEIIKILQRFGCQSVGFMDDFENHAVILAFTHRGRQVQLRASAKGWAAMYLKENPWSHQRKLGKQSYEQAALRQGLNATNSIIRDWVKGQVTAIETGILQFEAVFMPYMLASNGQTMAEYVQEQNLLPPPANKD